MDSRSQQAAEGAPLDRNGKHAVHGELRREGKRARFTSYHSIWLRSDAFLATYQYEHVVPDHDVPVVGLVGLLGPEAVENAT